MESFEKMECWIVCADEYSVYTETVPEEYLLQSKSQTVFIERNNGRQRHWFARFRRKSIAVSKTLEMVDLTMALFARFHVNGHWKEMLSLVSWNSPIVNELEATPNRIERITLRQNNVVNYNLRQEGICLAREERNSCYLSSNIGGKNMDEARQIAMEEWVINFFGQ